MTSETQGVSKRIFVVVCALLVLFAIAFFITLLKLKEEHAAQPPTAADRSDYARIENGQIIPMSDDLKQFVNKEQESSNILLKIDGQFRWTDEDNEKIKICGEVVKGQPVGDTLSLAPSAEMTILRTSSQAKCKLGRHQGRLAWVHVNPSAAGHLFPCHQ